MSEADAKGNNDPWLWFRMKTGLVDLVHPPQPGPGLVLAEWPAAAAVLGVDEPWAVTDDFFYVPNGRGAAHRYAARRGEQSREVEIYLSADGFPGAVDRMVEIATTTMLPQPPFDKAPPSARFGELNLMSDGPPYRSLIWTFRNLCIRTETSAGGEETLALARRVLDGVQRRVVEPSVFEAGRPHLSLPAGPVRLRPGESFRCVPVAPGGAAGLKLVAMPSGPGVAVLAQDTGQIVLQAREPGSTRVAVVLADPATLRCDAGVLSCEVRA